MSFLYPSQCHLFPSNNLRIPVEQNTGISEEVFKRVLSEVQATYDPIVSTSGKKLVLKNKWSDDTVNSDTIEHGNTWTINAYGGLARYKGMDADAYMLVLCHEMGHHLGGYPKYQEIFKMSWASNEGEADYFATLKCFRQMTLKDNANSRKRAIAAGFKLADILRDLDDEPAISLDTPDKTEVAETNDEHPGAQCRLDTYYAGVICTAALQTPLSDSDPKIGACSEEAGEVIGVRPHCWYKPQLNIWQMNSL